MLLSHLGLAGHAKPGEKRGQPKFSDGFGRLRTTSRSATTTRNPLDDGRPRDVDQQRARFHQGEPAGVDQSFGFRRKGAGDQDGVAQRQHTIDLGQGVYGLGRRGIGDRAAVGGQDPIGMLPEAGPSAQAAE
jgi:hypothetical protein